MAVLSNGMSRNGDLMRKALRRHVIPELHRRGFTGKSAAFQRLGDDFQDLLSIQFWKYGGEFILEFARRGRGPLATSWGEVVAEEKLDVAYVSPTSRGRLEQRGPATGQYLQGFDFSGFGEDIESFEGLARQVAGLLAQVDEWLRTQKQGEHVRSFSGRG